eukprot:s469_g28.t1
MCWEAAASDFLHHHLLVHQHCQSSLGFVVVYSLVLRSRWLHPPPPPHGAAQSSAESRLPPRFSESDPRAAASKTPLKRPPAKASPQPAQSGRVSARLTHASLAKLNETPKGSVGPEAAAKASRRFDTEGTWRIWTCKACCRCCCRVLLQGAAAGCCLRVLLKSGQCTSEGACWCTLQCCLKVLVQGAAAGRRCRMLLEGAAVRVRAVAAAGRRCKVLLEGAAVCFGAGLLLLQSCRVLLQDAACGRLAV